MKRQVEPDAERYRLLNAANDAARAEIGRWKSGVERLMREHRPYPDEEALRPGNAHWEVAFYCTECSTPWPCRIFQSLRAVFAEVRDWPPAAIPYAPLILRRVEKCDQPGEAS